MTDLENLQKKEAQFEAAEEKRQAKIEQQIMELFIQLPPAAQADLLDTLAEDLQDPDSEDDDA